jgi:hypothetical protein
MPNGTSARKAKPSLKRRRLLGEFLIIFSGLGSLDLATTDASHIETREMVAQSLSWREFTAFGSQASTLKMSVEPEALGSWSVGRRGAKAERRPKVGKVKALVRSL